MKIELDLPEIEGYEYTGEYRKPKEDEYYKAVRDARQAESDSSSEYPILKKKAPKYQRVQVLNGGCMPIFCSDGNFVSVGALKDAVKTLACFEYAMSETARSELIALRKLIN